MSILINKKPIETFKFYGGECHVKINPFNIGNQTEIMANLNNSDDIMYLLLSVDAIRRVNLETAINLIIPYFPYARQDRVCNEGESLSVKVMADIINSLSCSKVTIYDPHSDVTPALINKCNVITLADIVANSFLSKIILDRKLALVSPDAGAEKKTRHLAKRLSMTGQIVEVYCSSKIRDTLTGNITATEIYGDVSGKNLIIVDDICDGGMTFIELAKELKRAEAEDIFLYTTHGIFSKGLNTLKDHFNHLYCHHTMLSEDQIDSSILTILQNDMSI